MNAPGCPPKWRVEYERKIILIHNYAKVWQKYVSSSLDLFEFQIIYIILSAMGQRDVRLCKVGCATDGLEKNFRGVELEWLSVPDNGIVHIKPSIQCL